MLLALGSQVFLDDRIFPGISIDKVEKDFLVWSASTKWSAVMFLLGDVF